MSNRTRIGIVAGFLLVAAAASAFFLWKNKTTNSRSALLDLLPADASAVLYVDLADFRQSPFLKELYAWAPKPVADAEYAQFVSGTGFDYERDLDRFGLAIEKRAGRHFLAIADGRFDSARITAYAKRTGKEDLRNGRSTFHVPSSNENSEVWFTFLTAQRIALADDAAMFERLALAPKSQGQEQDHEEWRVHFERLSGSPIFALIRQDAATGEELTQRAPGGLRSPQLAALLDQLPWISIAGKPIGQRLQVVVEGESQSDQTTRQLSDFLNGALLLAEAGLNDPKLRTRMAERDRNAYLALLKSLDISRLDRGQTKAVRIVCEIGPEILAITQDAEPAPTQDTPTAQKPQSPPKRKSQKQTPAH